MNRVSSVAPTAALALLVGLAIAAVACTTSVTGTNTELAGITPSLPTPTVINSGGTSSGSCGTTGETFFLTEAQPTSGSTCTQTFSTIPDNTVSIYAFGSTYMLSGRSYDSPCHATLTNCTFTASCTARAYDGSGTMVRAPVKISLTVTGSAIEGTEAYAVPGYRDFDSSTHPSCSLDLHVAGAR